MKNLNKLGVTELEIKESTNILGGGCSFAYDVGFAIRLLGAVQLGTVGVELAIYDLHCNN